MRYRLYLKEDAEPNFVPRYRFATLQEAVKKIDELEDGPAFKVWDDKAEDWVDPHLVLLEAIKCSD